MSAPSAMSAPPWYAGVSCTNRSATRVGVTMTALASAGTLYFASYSMSTRTELPSGMTAVTRPTLTPEDPHVGALVDADGAREVRGHRLRLRGVAHQDQEGRGQQHHRRGDGEGASVDSWQHAHHSGTNSPVGMAARLTTYASNHGPVPMMLPRIEA